MKLLILCFAIFLTACKQNTGANLDTNGSVYYPDKVITRAVLPDFSLLTDIREKKSKFFQFMEPLIQSANQEVLAERKMLKDMDGQRLSREQKKWLQKLVRKYRINHATENEQVHRLLEKINVMPPSLPLAQAANESAWGTSRFAREGNNLFGQWCFSKGCGIIPKQRASTETHEVAIFKSPYESVRAYILNINRHKEYARLRKLRNQQFQQQGYVTGYYLASGLSGYSARGNQYVAELRNIIKFNGLDKFDLPNDRE